SIFRIPHSTFRIPHWGRVDAQAPHRRVPYRSVLHLGREPAGGGGGLVRVPWLRTAGRPVAGKAARAGRRPAPSRRARGPVALLPDRESHRTARRGDLDDAGRSFGRDRRLRTVPGRGVDRKSVV